MPVYRAASRASIAAQAWMCCDLINAHSRAKGVDAAFEAAEELQRQGSVFDGSVYYALMQACGHVRASPPNFALCIDCFASVLNGQVSGPLSWPGKPGHQVPASGRS